MFNQAEEALKQAVASGGGNIVCYQTGAAVEKKSVIADVEVNIEKLLAMLASGSVAITREQLASAMRKFLPLMASADEELKLGLGKVIGTRTWDGEI